jgi:hypothetical protein
MNHWLLMTVVLMRAKKKETFAQMCTSPLITDPLPARGSKPSAQYL